MFPPVRPRGYLEVRYLDAQRGDDWVAPTALLTALLAKRSTVDAAQQAAAPVVGRWLHAARFGLADTALANSAADVVALGIQELGVLGLPTDLADTVAEDLGRRASGGARA
jgi:glutamate--cysteine ligase